MVPNIRAISTPERLAYWYLRLNGFLTIENFVVHPDSGTNQRTDADLLGVRFGNRRENLIQPMKDDSLIAESHAYCNVVIAEVKSGACALNGPWTDKEEENIQRVLSAIGCVPNGELHDAASGLYESGLYESELATIRLLAFGDRRGLLKPSVRQIIFDEMLDFIYSRFQEFRNQKSSVGNWSRDGQKLARIAFTSRDTLIFKQRARAAFGLIAHAGL
jgi:hypothetical protein